MKYLFLLCAFLFCSETFAWDTAGHQIIAQIAYAQLTPSAKQSVDHLLAMRFSGHYAAQRFRQASTWPDQLKQTTKRYNHWHYINLPYVQNNSQPKPQRRHNLVWAIHHAETMTQNKQNTLKIRAEYLAFLIHLVGDATQPMHCVDLYNQHFKYGDKGGNSYPIHDAIADNLHAFWDEGLGLLWSKKTGKWFGYYRIKQLANEWMQQYPKTFFSNQLAIHSPQQWVQQSHELAIRYAYVIKMYAKPTQQYIANGQRVVRQQIVLAGYRLAAILNQLFTH